MRCVFVAWFQALPVSCAARAVSVHAWESQHICSPMPKSRLAGTWARSLPVQGHSRRPHVCARSPAGHLYGQALLPCGAHGTHAACAHGERRAAGGGRSTCSQHLGAPAAVAAPPGRAAA